RSSGRAVSRRCSERTRAAPGCARRSQALWSRRSYLERRESRFPDEDEYAFGHALWREGAYAMLTEADRSVGHGLAGEWLERRGEQDALLLAEHFEKGGEGGRAGVFYLRAAGQAAWGADAQAATAHVRRGLACPVQNETRIALLGALCDAAYWHGAV